jgi:hypothetical protein
VLHGVSLLSVGLALIEGLKNVRSPKSSVRHLVSGQYELETWTINMFPCAMYRRVY